MVDQHKEYIDKAMKGPILPTQASTPIVVVGRWSLDEDSLVKVYDFQTKEQRRTFVDWALRYEENNSHQAEIVLSNQDDSVMIRLQTHGINSVTDLDREHARFLDLAYRDVVYQKHATSRTPTHDERLSRTTYR